MQAWKVGLRRCRTMELDDLHFTLMQDSKGIQISCGYKTLCTIDTKGRRYEPGKQIWSNSYR